MKRRKSSTAPRGESNPYDFVVNSDKKDWRRGFEVEFDVKARRPNRVIQASRLEKLVQSLDGSVEVAIRITRAIIVGDLDLQHAAFKGGVSITDSVFTGDVNFSFSTFARSADFRGTRFRGDADFRGAGVKFDFDLSLSRFRKAARFDDLHVGEVLRCEGALFNRVSFRRARLTKNALFGAALRGSDAPRPTRFLDVADFSDAYVGGPAHFEGSVFKDQSTFERLHFGSAAYFECHLNPPPPGGHAGAHTPHILRTQFRGDADFTGMKVHGSASFVGAHFKGRAIFRRTQIEGNALFNHFALTTGDKVIFIPVVFSQDVYFWSSGVKGSAGFTGAQFRGEADFMRVQIGERLDFSAAEFKDALVCVRFGGASKFLDTQVEGSAIFAGTQFVGEANFERFRVGGVMFFRPAEHRANSTLTSACFHGGASFLSARVTGTAEFDGTQFKAGANFELIHIGGDAYFRPWNDQSLRVCFDGAANFAGATIKGKAEFSGTRFNAKANFMGVRFEGSAFFDSHHHYLDKKIRPVNFNGPVRFTSASFVSGVTFEDAFFRREADFTGVRCDSIASFRRALFRGDTIFHGADFTALIFCERLKKSTGGQFPVGRVSLTGLTYRHIEVDFEDLLCCLDKESPTMSQEFMSLRRKLCLFAITDGGVEPAGGTDINLITVKHSISSQMYDRQPYIHLASAFRSAGQDVSADKIYLMQRERVRAERRKRIGNEFKNNSVWRAAAKIPVYLFDLAYWRLSNYGVRPVRLLIISALVLLVGTFMFSREGAVEINRKNVPAVAGAKPDEIKSIGWPRAFAVSLNQFIPIVEIPSGSRWKPSENLIPHINLTIFSYAAYGTVHKLAGAVLVPLGIAAVTGLLHRREKLNK